jgi:hypothetical protein
LPIADLIRAAASTQPFAASFVMIRFFLIAIVILASAVVAVPQSDTVSADEYAVYSALINAKYIKSWTELAVIQTHTRLDTMGRDVPKEFGDTLAAKNNTTYTLERHFDISVKYVLLDKKQLDDLFHADLEKGWDSYWKQYQHATGLLTFSRVAFNAKGDEALLNASEVCGPLCGSGYLFRLKKDKDGWKVVDEQFLWIS